MANKQVSALTIETGAGTVTSFLFSCSASPVSATNLAFFAFLSAEPCRPRFLLNADMFGLYAATNSRVTGGPTQTPHVSFCPLAVRGGTVRIIMYTYISNLK